MTKVQKKTLPKTFWGEHMQKKKNPLTAHTVYEDTLAPIIPYMQK